MIPAIDGAIRLETLNPAEFKAIDLLKCFPGTSSAIKECLEGTMKAHIPP